MYRILEENSVSLIALIMCINCDHFYFPLMQNNLRVTVYIVVPLFSSSNDIIVMIVILASILHKVHFRPGLHFGPCWGAHGSPPRPLIGWGGGYPLHIHLHHLRRAARSAVVAPPPLSTPSSLENFLWAPAITNRISWTG